MNHFSAWNRRINIRLDRNDQFDKWAEDSRAKAIAAKAEGLDATEARYQALLIVEAAGEAYARGIRDAQALMWKEDDREDARALASWIEDSNEPSEAVSTLGATLRGFEGQE
jgi:hypothetical protein